MASKPRTPTYTLHMEREMTDKLYNQPPKSSIKPQTRNPITQQDLNPEPSKTHVLRPPIGTQSKPQGIAMGEYAAKSKRSDIFGTPTTESKASRKYIPHSNSETSMPSVALKRSDYQPPERNPITQDTLDEANPRVRTKISESSAFAHLTDGQTITPQTRDNKYYEHMSKNFFNVEPSTSKRLAKEANTYAPELGNVLVHSAYSPAVSSDPTKNSITRQDISQKLTLEANAKVYSARRNESSITF